MGQRFNIGDNLRGERHRQLRHREPGKGQRDADQNTDQRVGGDHRFREGEQQNADALRRDHVEETNQQHKQRITADPGIKHEDQQRDFRHQQRGVAQGIGRQLANHRQTKWPGLHQRPALIKHVDHAGDGKQLQQVDRGRELLVVDKAAAGVKQAAVVQGHAGQRRRLFTDRFSNDRAIAGIEFAHQAGEILRRVEASAVKQGVVIHHHAGLFARQHVGFEVHWNIEHGVILGAAQPFLRLGQTAFIG